LQSTNSHRHVISVGTERHHLTPSSFHVLLLVVIFEATKVFVAFAAGCGAFLLIFCLVDDCLSFSCGIVPSFHLNWFLFCRVFDTSSLLCLKQPFLILFNLVAFLTTDIGIGVTVVHHVHVVTSHLGRFLLFVFWVFLDNRDSLDLVHEIRCSDPIRVSATITALYHISLHLVKGEADLILKPVSQS
jgi:hypothetical protein